MPGGAPEHKADREIMLEAVKHNGHALKHERGRGPEDPASQIVPRAPPRCGEKPRTSRRGGRIEHMCEKAQSPPPRCSETPWTCRGGKRCAGRFYKEAKGPPPSLPGPPVVSCQHNGG